MSVNNSQLSILNSQFSDITAELTWRGLIHQMTDGTATRLREKICTLYIGFDPTADSLHVGHLVALMNLRRFQQAGHRPIALVGGGTGTIGDPSGKSEERKLISYDDIERNIRSVERQMRRFLRFDDSPNGAILANNYDWLGKFSYIDFLRDVGKHFPVNVMLAKDSVWMRLESDTGLSYTEFSYMLLQSYDFVHLHQTYGCELQVGGSDQWGNIVAGIDLARRLGTGQLYGLTSPLLTKSDGGKMGKTEAGTLWLDPNRTSPYQFFQYWINLDDADAEKTLKIFTELPQDEIAEILTKHGKAPEKRVAQQCLAEEITKLVHGDDGLAVARRATEIFFGGEVSQLDDGQLASIFADVPSKELPRNRLDAGLPLVDALYESGLAPSKAEARRTVQQGGAYINNRQMTDLDAKLGVEHLAGESVMVVRSGKKKYALLRFV